MKSFRHELTFNIAARMDFLNITPQVEAAVRESGVREGLCLVNAKHAALRLVYFPQKVRRAARISSVCP